MDTVFNDIPRDCSSTNKWKCNFLSNISARTYTSCLKRYANASWSDSINVCTLVPDIYHINKIFFYFYFFFLRGRVVQWSHNVATTRAVTSSNPAQCKKYSAEFSVFSLPCRHSGCLLCHPLDPLHWEWSPHTCKLSS
jgi:hypothetical protein